MAINFKEVGMPEETVKYVKPGFWKMAPVKAELTEKEGSTPYLTITFEGKAGKLTDKFWLSNKAAKRLNYLHNALYSKVLEKTFDTSEQVMEYFNTLFTRKIVPLNLKVGGEIATNGNIYAKLPYMDFVIADSEFEEGPLEEGSARYKELVKESTYNAPGTNAPIVNKGASKDEAMPWD